MDYKKIIDDLIDMMERETESAHELTTKALNHEYYEGQLYGVYKLAESALPLEEFVTLYDYRREDRDRVSVKANREIINRVYSVVRKYA